MAAVGKSESAMNKFLFDVTDEGVLVTEKPVSKGWLNKFTGSAKVTDLALLPREDERMLEAFAELRELGESGGVKIDSDRIFLSHDVLSRVSDTASATLELPPSVELTLKMEMDGQLGSPSFFLRTKWQNGGQEVVVRRTGAVLETEHGRRRIPAPLLRAVLEAERVSAEPANLAAHWERLALFRNALEPNATDPDTLPDFAQQCSMNSFLEGLKLKACSSLAIGQAESEDDFSPIPFAARNLEEQTQESQEADGLLSSQELARFQQVFRQRGATSAYRLAEGEFLVLLPGVLPLAGLMSRKQHAPAEERLAFMLNPEPFVREAYQQVRRDAHAFDAAEEVMGAADLEALDEAVVDARLVITIEYRDRVVGMGQFEAPDLSAYGAAAAQTTWMPERIAQIATILSEASYEELCGIQQEGLDALANPDPDTGESTVRIGDVSLPADAAIAAVGAEIEKRDKEREATEKRDAEDQNTASSENTILLTKTNFDALDWHPPTNARVSILGDCEAPNVRTNLMSHQLSSLDWSQRAWAFGLPGILNADEQGLGKTLQTLAFLSWLHKQMDAMPKEYRRPFLIVAPTSLLRNWEAEINLHLDVSRFATVTQLYGAQLSSIRESGIGTDVQTGEAQLDLEWLETACNEGRGHNHVLLTTYRTATNYHHSLHRLRFSALVFDEIQSLKNPATISATACRSLQADFRIGLTGTPIENKVQDLWAIMDQLSPGSFSTLKDFSEQFGNGERESLDLLNQRLLEPFEARPAIGIRRMKEHVASDLPPKNRILLPSVMSEQQALCYDEARVKLASSTRGGALKALHHIRSVSAHPGLSSNDMTADDLTSSSARLQQVVSALDWIAERGERALVFVEARKLQYRLAEYLAARYELDIVNVINGSTSISKRQKIVDKFQQHLEHDGGFDLLVLGPKAAGTGLTLTAANHVLHVSRWWNPAVEEQCNDRVHRIGQHRDVTIHLPLAIHPVDGPTSFDCLLQRLMLRKRTLATDVLAPMGESEGDVADIQNGLQAQAAHEVPSFDSPEIFREWVEARLENYLRNTSLRTNDLEEASVAVRLYHSKEQLLSSIDHVPARLIELHAHGPSRVQTRRLESGALIIELGGQMLNLWPEAVLESSEKVAVMAPG